jgi:hypothetical protein
MAVGEPRRPQRAGPSGFRALRLGGDAGASGVALTVVHVEVLFWDGCPSHPRAVEELREAMAELGLDPSRIELREVDTDAAAAAERFVGSPTIRIDGADIVPPPAGEPTGLTCRIYHRRDGRISPVPDPADVRDSLTAAMRSDAA